MNIVRLNGFLDFCVQILAVTARIIQKDAEEKKVSFNPRPYFRLFINWLSELTTSDLHQDSANFQVHLHNVSNFDIYSDIHISKCSCHLSDAVSFSRF
jgi:CCR4-NOT transcription complex subunit 1